MLQRHDYVTPYIDGIRFFDKPPLMYWMAAASMHIFGAYDWAARLPLALCVLGLFFAVYALGKRLFGERGGFYSALAMATSLGPYLFTRFYIPDILNALWMTLGAHLFLIALDRLNQSGKNSGIKSRSALVPSLGFAGVMALNLLTKGLIGIVFPIGFVLFYLVLTRQLRLLTRLHLVTGTLFFAIIALPWHILAALRNPPIALPSGLGLPAKGGWFWFYIVNEHFMRFVGKRIPHDYGQVPIPLFWLLFFLWLMPWTAFLPAAILRITAVLRDRIAATSQQRENALTLALWSLMVLVFFTLSSRQEYYSLPALPALALMAGGVLGLAEAGDQRIQRYILRGTTWFLLPLATITAIVCGYWGIVAPTPPHGTDLSSLLTTNPDAYTLSLGHLRDLTGHAMGFFRAPLLGTALSMLGVGLITWLLRRRDHTFAANITLAISMMGTLLCVHSGLARFYPILGSKGLALTINRQFHPGDRILLDGEFTTGSTIIFYTRQSVSLVNGRVNGPWFGSFWPDAPAIFETDDSLRRAWTGQQRLFLMTSNPQRASDLSHFGTVNIIAAEGGKTILSNRR